MNLPFFLLDCFHHFFPTTFPLHYCYSVSLFPAFDIVALLPPWIGHFLCCHFLVPIQMKLTILMPISHSVEDMDNIGHPCLGHPFSLVLRVLPSIRGDRPIHWGLVIQVGHIFPVQLKMRIFSLKLGQFPKIMLNLACLVIQAPLLVRWHLWDLFYQFGQLFE